MSIHLAHSFDTIKTSDVMSYAAHNLSHCIHYFECNEAPANQMFRLYGTTICTYIYTLIYASRRSQVGGRVLRNQGTVTD